MRIVKKESLFKRVRASKKVPCISHLLFADGCILFRETTNKLVRHLKSIL